MRKAVLIAIIVVPLAIAGLFFGRTRLRGHRLELKAYFQDAQGLRVGAPVRVAGIDVGLVKSVRPRTDLPQKPAEVVMDLWTPYQLQIPDDAEVSLATAGVVGQTYANIEVRSASGPPAGNGAVLKAKPSQPDVWLELLQRLAQPKPCASQNTDAAKPAPPSDRRAEKAGRITLESK